MAKIIKHSKQIGIFNAICLALITMYEIYILFTVDNTPLAIASSITSVLAYAFGIFYTFKGSTKEAAAYYKIFMMLFLLASILCAVELLTNAKATALEKIAYIICVILLVILSTVDNLGKSKTFYLGLLVLSLYFICWAYEVIHAYNPIAKSISTLGKVFLSGAACLFISAKYEDKDKRGTI